MSIEHRAPHNSRQELLKHLRGQARLLPKEGMQFRGRLLSPAATRQLRSHLAQEIWTVRRTSKTIPNKEFMPYEDEHFQKNEERYELVKEFSQDSSNKI